jgi:hypothetical protein
LIIYVEKKIICGHCNACPFDGQINNTHATAKYIKSNPPKVNKTEFKRQTRLEEASTFKTVAGKDSNKDDANDVDDDDSDGWDDPNDDDKDAGTLKNKSSTVEKESTQKAAAEEESKIEGHGFSDKELIDAIRVRYHKEKDEVHLNEFMDYFDILDIPKVQVQKRSLILFKALFDPKKEESYQTIKRVFSEFAKRYAVQSLGLDMLLNLEVCLIGGNDGNELEKYVGTCLLKFYQLELISDEEIRKWERGETK